MLFVAQDESFNQSHCITAQMVKQTLMKQLLNNWIEEVKTQLPLA